MKISFLLIRTDEKFVLLMRRDENIVFNNNTRGEWKLYVF
jgi:hypothetical protein